MGFTSPSSWPRARGFDTSHVGFLSKSVDHRTWHAQKRNHLLLPGSRLQPTIDAVATGTIATITHAPAAGMMKHTVKSVLPGRGYGCFVTSKSDW